MRRMNASCSHDYVKRKRPYPPVDVDKTHKKARLRHVHGCHSLTDWNCAFTCLVIFICKMRFEGLKCSLDCAFDFKLNWKEMEMEKSMYPCPLKWISADHQQISYIGEALHRNKIPKTFINKFLGIHPIDKSTWIKSISRFRKCVRIRHEKIDYGEDDRESSCVCCYEKDLLC